MEKVADEGVEENVPQAHPTVTKVVVAVHGVGDQYSYETIQSVVAQFCRFYRQPAAIPLGSFHTGHVGFSLRPPYPADPFADLAFAEVYWAKIPRAVVNDKHTIEESRKWAATIVGRLRLRWQAMGSAGNSTNRDFDLIQLILADMIQTLTVLERLCYLAERAGLFTFDLKKLLDDYLGDVQIVAEFKSHRDEILEDFDRVLTAVHDAYPEAELFVIAHSEGTVISFLGLLQAGRNPADHRWIHNVRGLMTMGSPIDKHLILWPDLFDVGLSQNSQVPTRPSWQPHQKIEWRNYHDNGDPIGSLLVDTRAWLEHYTWDRVFNFTQKDDIKYSRSLFPGKAHVDYWTDQAVFGHFIETVVNKGGPPAGFSKPPANKFWNRVMSYVLPYVGITALLFVGAYILYKAVLGAIDPHSIVPDSSEVILRSVASITVLLLGITIMTRMARLSLTKKVWWRIVALVLGGGLTYLSLFALRIGSGINVLGLTVPTDTTIEKVMGAIVLALAVYVGNWVLTKIWPAVGLTPLVLLGSTMVAVRIVHHLQMTEVKDHGPIWPVFLATAAFLYLWWLAALLFDLVFVWHCQLRWSRGLKYLDEVIGVPVLRDGEAQRAPTPASALREPEQVSGDLEGRQVGVIRGRLRRNA
jgi:hypothetical protein